MNTIGHSIICIGELLIDFFCKDVNIDLIEGQNFEKQAGGAPANVCATIASLGGDARFCGKVGADPFGYFLKKTLDTVNVDTSMLLFDREHPTTLAFVSLQGNGERDFVFNSGADAYLHEQEIDKTAFNQAEIIHFGSATALLDDPFRSTYINMMKRAKIDRKFISFDPNYRKDLWKERTPQFIEFTKEAIALADFVKVSEEEIGIITKKHDVRAGIDDLHQLGASIISVTLGKTGTLVSNGNRKELIPSIEVNAIDSTGAGDAFVGAALFQIAKKKNPHDIVHSFQDLKDIILFSNKIGAFTCTQIGAISAVSKLQSNFCV
uniref:carbohydrate kinase family protein n=1 Tax=Metabacillus halosaccharovorans TaxID=930124 RepID=UPI003F65ED3C